ncbi:MAG: hypothetical protein QOH33_1403, partial [Paraburkholderia sp.]|nr:hypothetical protein [Paraburkholderia sp.]
RRSSFDEEQAVIARTVIAHTTGTAKRFSKFIVRRSFVKG